MFTAESHFLIVCDQKTLGAGLLVDIFSLKHIEASPRRGYYLTKEAQEEMVYFGSQFEGTNLTRKLLR